MTAATEIRCAALQLVSGADVDANLRQIDALLGGLARQGAELVLLPENALLMGRRERDKLAIAEDEAGGPLQDALAALARRHRVVLITGSLPLRVPGDPARTHAACLVHDAHGERLACYHKIHLFDVAVGGAESYRESATIAPGAEPAPVVDCGGVKVGLSICYDLRFPELYRAQVAAGAQLLVVPAAFTYTTGQAHWQPLLRARAIENLCYVVAANQGGEHANGRRTWGHSQIISPWGEVLDHCATGPGAALASLNLASQADLRQRFPCLEHRTL